MNGRMRFVEPEPCAVGADVVAELLERIGWPESAALVRQLSREDAQAYRQAEQWRQLYHELREKHEPSAPREAPRNYQPPPEASD